MAKQLVGHVQQSVQGAAARCMEDYSKGDASFPGAEPQHCCQKDRVFRRRDLPLPGCAHHVVCQRLPQKKTKETK